MHRAHPPVQRVEQRVGQLGRLSNRLDGWHFVLDPGHGGLDPGAVAAAVDGNDNNLYVTEDEYVYDVDPEIVDRVACKAGALYTEKGTKYADELLTETLYDLHHEEQKSSNQD